ncbi:MAG: type II secretion system major pseudopilin GspG [Thermodesulfobacteriota bacterium]
MKITRHQQEKARRPRSRAEAGFSLIELMAVIVILGLLASVVGPKVFNRVRKAKQQTAKTQIEMLMTSLNAYRMDVGSYPSQSDGLESLAVNPGRRNWDGPYLAKGLPQDPWGNAYIYQNPGEHGEVDIISYGLDGQAGGDKENRDIGSWE